MVTAIILLKVDRKRIKEVADSLLATPDITEVYSVSGRYSLVAIIRTSDNDKLECIVTDHLLKIDGILETETMFAFRTYSKRDIEALFSVD
ncbi:Lrp/AsnC family transcriptional regulator [Opitutaceae bacterium TAV4]|uniref:Lrp/AsnC family transcriptional regulator n=1 Tax=Geminisphaera colitermitum TaxID=1148786 RepID=UPI000158D190|nr:Lrp/AsnC ligand binding domain-containing protein [Geminisphaera colitermitum]RRJ96301.1 Lrp/AsnC family transcriptional regulator [Opitutaceae bacterium TAV4]RRK00419.1 Lrp/AsnC family transcriptional regulator [Opitutaceae bacterium TAV3]